MELMNKKLQAGIDGSGAATLAHVFDDEKLNDAIRRVSEQPNGSNQDIRPLVINRFLQIAADPGEREFELGEMQFMSEVLTQLKSNEVGRNYANKIDVILQKYPKEETEPEEEQPEQPEQPAAEPAAPAAPAPQPPAPAPAAAPGAVPPQPNP